MQNYDIKDLFNFSCLYNTIKESIIEKPSFILSDIFDYFQVKLQEKFPLPIKIEKFSLQIKQKSFLLEANVFKPWTFNQNFKILKGFCSIKE